MRGAIVDVAALALALVLAIVKPNAEWVERHFANGWYPPVQTTVTGLTNRVPFAVTDLEALLVFGGLIAWWIVRLRRSRARLRTAAMMAAHTIGVASILTVIFFCAWGFNYQRPPMASRVAFDPARVNPQSVDAYAKTIVAALNTTAPEAHAHALDELTMETRLQADFEPVVRALGDRAYVTLTRPKSTLINRYLSFAGIGGLFDPFAYETIVNADFLDFERPFAIAHEWGHAAAFADETDANYIAALTTQRSPSPYIRYSGLVWIYGYLPREVTNKYPLSPLVTADLTDSYRRYMRYLNRIVFNVQWSAYDKYLKANRVQSGVVSYTLFVNFLVGTARDEHGLPIVRGERGGR